MTGSPAPSPFRQPKAVWAVAFACVVSFMGIGLVDPILPALATQLKASPSTVELLFTSYLLITAVAMLVTGWVSSRLGAKRTLVGGLSLIVVFSAAGGLSHSISQIVGFRAGWGLGNALFIATSLAVIVGAASGGFAGAIMLYETALGLGFALGPLVGGELGGISWRGPFFGVSVLMGVSLVATVVFLDPLPPPARRSSIREPLAALRHGGLATMSVMALCYNWGFFTLLAYTPFTMRLGVHQLGYVFTGWGVLVGLFAVFAAPRLKARYGAARTLLVNLGLLAVDLVVIGAFTSSRNAVIVAVIASGMFVGLNNTLTTQAVMEVAPVERSVASAAYGFVRFIGGGLAPFCAGKLAAHFDVHVPFYVGAAAVVVGMGVLYSGRRRLEGVGPAVREIAVVATRASAAQESAPVVVALDTLAHAEPLLTAAADLAHLLDAPVEVLHVLETNVAGEDAIERGGVGAGEELVARSVERLAALGTPASGHVLRVVNDHAETGRQIARFANDRHALLVVIGSPADPALAALFDANLSRHLVHRAQCDVYIVRPERPARSAATALGGRAATALGGRAATSTTAGS